MINILHHICAFSFHLLQLPAPAQPRQHAEVPQAQGSGSLQEAFRRHRHQARSCQGRRNRICGQGSSRKRRGLDRKKMPCFVPCVTVNETCKFVLLMLCFFVIIVTCLPWRAIFLFSFDMPSLILASEVCFFAHRVWLTLCPSSPLLSNFLHLSE